MPNPVISVEKTGRNPQLDGLRAISVALVIFSHLVWAMQVSPKPGEIRAFTGSLGQLGVEVFFGISGFIITRTLLEELATKGRVALGAFYARRFFRIVPAYWTFLLFVLVLMKVGEIQVDPVPFARSLLFVSNLQSFPPQQGWFVGHSWTLSVEEQYYVLFPILFWTLLRGRRGLLCLTVGLIYFVTIFENRLGRLPLPFDSTYLDFISWFKYILAGVFLALVWERVAVLFRKVPAVVPVAFVLFLVTRSFYTGAEYLRVTNYVQDVEALAIVFVIGWLVQNPQSCGFLRWRALQWLGRSSYSFYLWQQLYTGRPELYGMMVLSRLPLSLALLCSTAALSYYFVEKPFIRLGHQLSERLTQRKSTLCAMLLDEDEEARKLPEERVEAELIALKAPREVPK